MNNKFAFMDLRTPEDATNALNLTGIPFLGEHLKISRPSKYSGPFVQTKTWGEMIGQAPSVGSAVPDTNTKNYREVFVGNLPMDMVAPEPIYEFFNLVMRKLGFASSLSIGKDPVVNVRMNKKFCFVEFFTVEEAIIAKNFDGIPFNGGSLSIKSPSNVKKNPDIQLFSWEGMLRRWVDGELKLAVSGETTNIICLENMLTEEELLSQDAVDQVLRDTREECMIVCAEQGQVLDIQFKAVSTLSSRGRIFIEMEALESAKEVMCALKGRDFDSRYVCSKFYPLGAYKEGNFGLNLPDVPICALSPSGAFVTSAHEFMSGA
jgi:splicing factor U2AF subunit